MLNNHRSPSPLIQRVSKTMNISILKRAAILAVFAFMASGTFGQGKAQATDPLTHLPLFAGAGGSTNGNPLPPGRVCRSGMKGTFYMLNDPKVTDVVSWYAAHLSGFKKAAGTESKRAQVAFYNADGTILVIVTGDPGSTPVSGQAFSVAYEQYSPGISEKTAASLTTGHIVCN